MGNSHDGVPRGTRRRQAQRTMEPSTQPETTPPASTVAGIDIGTNLLVAWLIQLAVLGDCYQRRVRWWAGGLSGAVNLAFILWKIAVGPVSSRMVVVRLGTFGGFHIGEALLILDSLLAVALLHVRHGSIPGRARPLWYLTTGIFLLGALLATASNQQVGFRILAYHATWHIVGAFGFILLWAFNHVRFAGHAAHLGGSSLGTTC